MSKIKGTIAILTGGGDVPGLNPAIRAATIRANRNGYRVVGLRNGWEGIMKIDRTKSLENQQYCQILTEQNVQKIARTGGTFLHTSRTKPSKVAKEKVPESLQDQYNADENDLTAEIIKNLEYLGSNIWFRLEVMIPSVTVCGCMRLVSVVLEYRKRWIMMFQVQIIASVSAPA